MSMHKIRTTLFITSVFALSFVLIEAVTWWYHSVSIDTTAGDTSIMVADPGRSVMTNKTIDTEIGTGEIVYAHTNLENVTEDETLLNYVWADELEEDGSYCVFKEELPKAPVLECMDSDRSAFDWQARIPAAWNTASGIAAEILGQRVSQHGVPGSLVFRVKMMCQSAERGLSPWSHEARIHLRFVQPYTSARGDSQVAPLVSTHCEPGGVVYFRARVDEVNTTVEMRHVDILGARTLFGEEHKK